MKQFFKDLLSSRNTVSSKRVISLLAFLNVLALSWVSTLLKLHVDQFIYDGLLWLAGAGLGLTVVEKMFKAPENLDTKTWQTQAL